ncbi:MAG: geranylgeranylglyceryl/heptaprenylglyceryl phosphate synthase [Methanobacteriota archaeon]|jgi:phosphoglycerol geranylgeranyltransferase|nr:MAG: geranylgeranylglyceryl/heptaprenylglyceryl phosphate synthase [Euryarchaeota archaeon]HIK78441.1 geranylgeranylglyceryl/heptaprenylglyceryl phosphate synthase [Candidatus Poseidoniales archaeon]
MIPDSYSNILAYIQDKQFGCRHAILIDPANQSPEIASNRVLVAIESGCKLIMVGGSTNTSNEDVNATVVAIQEALELKNRTASQNSNGGNFVDWQIPVVLFPGGGHALSPAADAITFMMLMNSTDPKFLVQEQKKGAPYLFKYGIEALPTGYVVCSPGGKVGEVGKVNLIKENDLEDVNEWALCAKMFGFKLLYLEAGSGAHTPVSTELIETATKIEGLTILVGGGINDSASANNAKNAGADWIVTGTLAEKCDNLEELKNKLTQIIEIINY